MEIQNCGSITLLTVFINIIEFILKLRMRPRSIPFQCTLQRSLAHNRAPLRVSFIVIEVNRGALHLEQLLNNF